MLILNLFFFLLTEWSVQEVVQNFLERAGMGYMAEQFTFNKISGKVLMLLTEVGIQYHDTVDSSPVHSPSLVHHAYGLCV